MSSPRTARAVGLGILLGLLWIMFGPASPAAAHAYLESSDPPDGAVVSEAPAAVVLRFSEPVRPVVERILVVGPDGQRVDAGEPRAEGAELIIPLGEGADARGTHLVSYRVISADNHPVGGAFTYSVGSPSEPPQLPTGEDLDDPALRTGMSATRYLGYAGLVLVVGPTVMLALLWPHRLSRQGLARLVWAGLGLIGVSTLAAFWLQAPYTTGKSLSDVTAVDLRDVVASTFGQAHLVRLAVLVAATLLLRPVLAGRGTRSDLVLLGGFGLVALGTWPASGHPIASPLPAVSMVVAMGHLAAAAFWVGGLVVLAGFLLRRADERELGVILPVWAGWAGAAVATLLISGVIQTMIEVGLPEALFTTSYGRLLLAKVGLVLVVISVAVYSRRLVRQRAAAGRPYAMRTAVTIEAVLLAGVVVFSSLLVQTTPARSEAAAEQGAVAIAEFNTTLDSDLYSLRVTVEPAEVGGNTVHLYAYDQEGEPQPVEEWQATAALPAEEIEPIEITMLRITDNHAIGETSLPVPGEWEFRFTLRVSEIDQESVSATVPVR